MKKIQFKVFNVCQVLITLLSYPYSVRLVVEGIQGTPTDGRKTGVVVSKMTDNIYFLLTSLTTPRTAVQDTKSLEDTN